VLSYDAAYTVSSVVVATASHCRRGSQVKDPRSRFSDRADNYAKYRPGYPREVLKFLEDRGALTGGSVVADIGSGTGKLSELFLENGNRVLAVEPNEEMRRAAERLLGDHPGFESIAGAAEDTTLAAETVDLLVVANSLHWVQRDATRAEFSRVLRPGGRVAVVWNNSRTAGTPFLEAYSRLVSRYRTNNGTGVDAEDVYEMTKAFFDDGCGEGPSYEVDRFPYSQRLDFEGLEGLVLSSSSMPVGDEPGSERMLRDLEEVFSANESDGEVVMEYEVSVYCGGLR
jgi:ubiquinone/menaquinone biosynthesis C-methylase UbiE